ncbi:MAG: YPO3983 family protein [Bacteroidales bacterium]
MGVSGVSYPCVLFKTQRMMNDYAADDMRYGDMPTSVLKQDFGLHQVSHLVEPYTLKRRNPIPDYRWQRGVYESVLSMAGHRQDLSVQECTDILFNEFRQYSRLFTLWGPYSHLMGKMIDHMQQNSGTPFYNPALDLALQERILEDKSSEGPVQVIRKTLIDFIDWERKELTIVGKENISHYVRSNTKLPKFTGFWPIFDGTKITVHDIHALHIRLKFLQINGNRFHAVVHFDGQDHFGLDVNDITHSVYRYLPIFRVWFVLQRYERFGFRPFLTNMQATVDIYGSQGE